jgi:hypothetical protein
LRPHLPAPGPLADAAITKAIDAHIDAERGRDEDGDDGASGVLVPAG